MYFQPKNVPFSKEQKIQLTKYQILWSNYCNNNNQKKRQIGDIPITKKGLTIFAPKLRK